MERKDLELRCIIEKEGEAYSAICLDLDVASCGETPEKAAKNLTDAILLYLEYAGDSDRFDEMVPRPVPEYVMKEYEKKLRKKSSEHQERLRPKHVYEDYMPKGIALSYQYA